MKNFFNYVGKCPEVFGMNNVSLAKCNNIKNNKIDLIVLYSDIILVSGRNINNIVSTFIYSDTLYLLATI